MSWLVRTCVLEDAAEPVSARAGVVLVRVRERLARTHAMCHLAFVVSHEISAGMRVSRSSGLPDTFPGTTSMSGDWVQSTSMLSYYRFLSFCVATITAYSNLGQ